MSNQYAKVSIPRPLFEQLKEPGILGKSGFRSPSDAATHAIRQFLADQKGAA